MKTRVVGDLSTLPDHAFGLRSTVWWGLLGFMAIEATAFVLAMGAWLYIKGVNDSWPPPTDDLPGLLPGVITTLLMLASEAANRWLAHTARTKMDEAERQVVWGLTGMAVVGVLIVIVRFFEFPQLHTRWDVNAYGSVVWLLMVLHTIHLITDLADTIVMSVWAHTHDMTPTQFSEVYDNCGYWSFVVVAWLPIWVLVYLVPRL